MKAKKRVLSAILAALFLFGMIPAGSVTGLSDVFRAQAADVLFGSCGDTGEGNNVTWTLDTATGELAINGTGNMKDYTSSYAVPWHDERTLVTTVTIGDGVTGIGYHAFYYCTSLERVTISDSVTTISNAAFAWCTNLTSVTIGTSVTTIGDWAFQNCTSLTDVAIPDSVTNIGNMAFYECIGLAAITVDPNNSVYCSDSRDVLYNRDKTELIQYPAGNPRTAYAIPEGVTTIRYGAFCGSANLEFVHVPSTLRNIGEDAFRNCANLTSICCETTNLYAQSYAEANDIEFLLCSGHPELSCEHMYTSSVTTEPTCLEEGVRTYICSECGTGYTESIPALGHDYEQTVIPPNCTEYGYTLHKCARCGDEFKTDETEPIGHIWGDGEVTQAATCTEDGEMTCICTVCGATTTQAVDALGHEYEETVVPAKCTEGGYTLHKCSRCGDEFKTDETEPAGHDWLENQVTKAATCTDAGEMTCTCAVCGATGVEPIAALGHDYSVVVSRKEATCGDYGYTVYKCIRCSETENREYTPATGNHNWSEWRVTVQPTEDADGEETRKCAVCGKEETRIRYQQREKGIIVDYSQGAFGAGEDPDLIIEELDPVEHNEQFLYRLPVPNAESWSGYIIEFKRGENTVIPVMPVTVRIPIPQGADASKCEIIHVFDHELYTESFSLSERNLTIDGDYFVIQVSNFSPFLIYEIKDPPKVSIQTNYAASILRYGETVTLTADVKYLPTGAQLIWTADNDRVTLTPSDDGKTCDVTSQKNGVVTVTVTIVDANGKPIKIDGKEIAAEKTIRSRATFLYKLLWFLKRFFGIEVVIQTVPNRK